MRQQQTIHSAQHPLNNEQFLQFPCPCSTCHYPREVPAQRVRQGNRQLRFTTSGIKLQGVGNLKRLTVGTTKTSHSQNILLRVTDKSKTHWTVYFLRCFYLRAIYEDGQCDIGFVLGKAQLTPIGETTIPKFELYAAMLTVERSDLKPDVVYCNNKVVLGYIYIYIENRQFYVGVHNWVQRIGQSTKPEQLHYVPTEHNPTNHTSRSVFRLSSYKCHVVVRIRPLLPTSQMSSCNTIHLWIDISRFLICPIFHIVIYP